MKPQNFVAVVITGVTLTALASQARAQSSSKDIEPEAIEALNKMGTYLHTLKSFQVKAVTSNEDVYEDGQKVQYETSVDMLARAPNGLRVQVKSDRQDRLFLYNGKDFTLFGQRTNFYATAPAPPTIGELIERLKEKFGIDTPLADLFYWGTDKSSANEILSASDIGPSQVDGTSCEQYIFRQPGLDWQIWIQQGDYPLPRKLVLSTLGDEARPEYISVMTWNLAPSFNDGAFTFDPPQGVMRIAFSEAK